MSRALWSLVKTARQIGQVNPLLGYELERHAVSVINPGARKFEQNLGNSVTVLEALKDELEDALKMLDTEDAKEFAKFFEDAGEAEEEELRQMLRKVSTTAGFKDFFNKFKDVFKSKEKDTEGDQVKANEPSYQLDESTMDEFVEGKREWADPGHYIEQEAKENAQFFSGVEKILDEVDAARKKPNRKIIQDILKKVEVLIRKGKNLGKGIREHLMEPAPKVEITEEGMKSEKPAEKKKSPEALSLVVSQYGESLQDAAGDEARTVRLLKELFEQVKPFLKEDRAELASSKTRAAAIFIRYAYAMPRMRSRLLPVVYQLTGR
jgi:hypothetical protein